MAKFRHFGESLEVFSQTNKGVRIIWQKYRTLAINLCHWAIFHKL